MSAANTFDAIVIGGGHNGLVCAFYLARAGLKVVVLEARHIVGGAAVTEEFHPGFRNSVASYTVSLLQPRVIADMRLHDRGLVVKNRPISNMLPQPDGGYLKLGGGLERTQAEFRRFSARDADTLPDYYAALEDAAGVLRALALKTPPNAGGGLAALVGAARAGWPMAGLGAERQRNVLDLFTKSARRFLDMWFESEAVKAAFGFDAVVGNYASPDAPGSAYVLLHHVFGEANGVPGAWGHAMGGMGAITQAMAEACVEAGVDIRLNSPVAAVSTEAGRTTGVRLASGEELHAPVVAANVGPKLLFDRLVAPDAVPPEFRRAMKGFTVGSGTFRMNVALSELPDFTCLPTVDPAGDEHHQSGIIIAPTLDYMDQAFADARAHGWSRAPIVEILCPSTVDPGLAPPGRHVASLFCQQFAPAIAGGWDAHRQAAADCVIDTVTMYAPNFRRSVLGMQINSPLDLERNFGLMGGDIMHGNMSLDQLWGARPLLGHADYRTPIAGLWMCGAGTHPGGGVTGAPGHNAAHEILADARPLGRLRRAFA